MLQRARFERLTVRRNRSSAQTARGRTEAVVSQIAKKVKKTH